MTYFKIDLANGVIITIKSTIRLCTVLQYCLRSKILSFTESADTLTSVFSYSRKPKRITFECFIDDWIEVYVLPGDYEIERYISQWKARFIETLLAFHRLTGTSLLQYDYAKQVKNNLLG